MRSGRTIGVALVALIVAALATLWQAPPVVAAGQQGTGQGQGSGSQSQQAEKPRIERQVLTHSLQAEPMIAALAGGPRIGVRIRDVGKEDVAKLKLSSQSGVVVEEVTKASAAEKAGVKAGDVVVQFDGENVRSAVQMTRLVRESVAGRAAKLGVVRDGRRMDLDVAPEASTDTFDVAIAPEKLENLEKHLEVVPEGGRMYRFERRMPESGQTPPPGGMWQWRQQMPMPLPEGGDLQWFGEGGSGNFVFSTGRGRLGVRVQELAPELATYFGVKDGLLVNSVETETPASKAGIKAGDVIGSVNGKAVATTAELVKELADKDGEVTIGVTRDKKPLTLKATLEPRKTPVRHAPAVGRPA